MGSQVRVDVWGYIHRIEGAIGRDVSQAEIARGLGISNTYLSQIKKGDVNSIPLRVLGGMVDLATEYGVFYTHPCELLVIAHDNDE